MRNKKHTKGPWSAPDYIIWRGAADSALFPIHAAKRGRIGTANRFEDAVLMASAPDLLALLVESKDSIGGDWRERRDAVIAKATGAQQ